MVDPLHFIMHVENLKLRLLEIGCPSFIERTHLLQCPVEEQNSLS